jgi:thiamine biosynthesis lipoprotein
MFRHWALALTRCILSNVILACVNEQKASEHEKLGKKNRRDTLIVIALVIALIVTAFLLAKWLDPGYSRKPYRREADVLDDHVVIYAYGKNKSQVEGAVDDAFKEIFRIDAIANRYNPESELSVLNANATQEPVVVSDDLWDMITSGMEINQASGGLFDITVGPLADLWDVTGRYARNEPPPSDEEIKLALEKVGSDKLVLDPGNHSVYLSREGMIIDLGGLAKGYALDQAEKAMSARGVGAGVIDMVSTSMIIGDKPEGLGGPLWEFAISGPRGGDDYLGTFRLPGGLYMSTSGDYQRFFEYNGVRYHHILDPRTGYPARGSISATVIGGRSGTWSDAISTAIFIMGYPDGLSWAQNIANAEVVLVDSEGKVYTTPGIAQWVENLKEKI